MLLQVPTLEEMLYLQYTNFQSWEYGVDAGIPQYYSINWLSLQVPSTH